MAENKKLSFKWIFFPAVTLAVAVCAALVLRTAFGPSVQADEKGVPLYIATGTTLEELDSILRPHLKHTFLLDKIIARAVDKRGKVHAGRFTLRHKQSTYDAVMMFFAGRGEQVAVRFNGLPGVEELAGVVSRQIEADSLSLLQAFYDREMLDTLGLDSLSVVSLFIPNTYHFYWDTSAGEFMKRMLREYRSFWNEKRSALAQDAGLTPLQVSTLASIVRAETAKTDERPVVAGLYMNRLKKGMRLQSDPTVIYAMRLTGEYTLPIRRVYLKDLKIDSPFNTYRIKGLPPAPINIPDISSIDAVLNYARHKYVYMCASVENFGYHEFASSAAQHNANRRKYIRWLNEKDIK